MLNIAFHHNLRGWSLRSGSPSTSEQHTAFELNGVSPEPATVAFLGLGGIFLADRRRSVTRALDRGTIK
jgi:hypothetical protein